MCTNSCFGIEKIEKGQRWHVGHLLEGGQPMRGRDDCHVRFSYDGSVTQGPALQTNFAILPHSIFHRSRGSYFFTVVFQRGEGRGGGFWSHLGAGAIARGDELAALGAREAEPAGVRGLAESAVDFVLLLLVTRLGKIVLVENVPGNLLRQCEETRVGAAPFGRLGRLLHLEVESLVIGDAMVAKLPKRQTGAHEDESRARHGRRVRRDAAVFF